MSDEANIGYGAVLRRSDGASPPNMVAIAKARIISGFGVERPRVDTTHLTSPGGFMEYKKGMRDGAEFTVEAIFLPQNATQSLADGLMGDVDSEDAVDFEYELPNGMGGFAFTALVFGWKTGNVEAGTVISATFSFKITGPVTDL